MSARQTMVKGVDLVVERLAEAKMVRTDKGRIHAYGDVVDLAKETMPGFGDAYEEHRKRSNRLSQDPSHTRLSPELKDAYKQVPGLRNAAESYMRRENVMR